MLIISTIKKIYLIPLLLITLTACGTVNKMEYYENTKSTSLSEEVKTISINSSEKKVREIFGEPDRIEKPEISNSTYYTYGNEKNKKFISFELINEKVVRYFYPSKKYQTAKGIFIGSSKQEIIQAYGKNFYEREDTGSKVIGYFDKSQKINIEFSMNKDLEAVIVSKINGY